MRVLSLAAFLLASTASAALARPPETIRMARPAPMAVLVDGVKVGSSDQLSLTPKTERVRTGGSCSSCTLMVTY